MRCLFATVAAATLQMRKPVRALLNARGIVNDISNWPALLAPTGTFVVVTEPFLVVAARIRGRKDRVVARESMGGRIATLCRAPERRTVDTARNSLLLELSPGR